MLIWHNQARIQWLLTYFQAAVVLGVERYILEPPSTAPSTFYCRREQNRSMMAKVYHNYPTETKKNFKATSKPSNIKYQKINTEFVRNFQGSVRNWKRLYEVQYFIFFSFRSFWNLLKNPLPFANLPSFSLWLEWTQSWSHFITLPMAFLAKNLWVWKDTANRRLFFWVKCLALLRNKCKARASQRTNRWDVAFVVILHWSAS